VLIRRLSNGAKSLNDFCRTFHGGAGGAPELKPYTFEDVAAALNSVQPYDWAKFLRDRTESAAPRAPLGGIENGGWKIVYDGNRSSIWKDFEEDDKNVDLSYSLGMIVKEDGSIDDVALGSPAYRAGVAPAVKLIAVDGRQFNPTLLREAAQKTASGKKSIDLLIKNGEYYQVHTVEYVGGEKYPRLVRDESKPDVLSEILKPLAK
jgi:predicted metalloprotease with PDZ domain